MKRILFVESHARELEALQRMLQPYAGDWEMVFVSSAQAALESLFTEEEPFVAIVADPKLSLGDGSKVLKLVQEQYPRLVRIAVSDGAETEAKLRAVPVAHQSVAKPYAPAVLKSVVERALSLNMMLNDEAMRTVVSSMDSLPARPKAYNALTLALADPRTGLADVAALVEQDLALSAKCLQLVNSAFFGLARRVNNIHQAVTYLGTSMLQSLVLSVEVFGDIQAHRFPGFSIDGLQAHGLRTARLAAGLLDESQTAEDAFMAAMLHDVGKIVLATRLPDRFRSSLVEARARRLPLHVIEQEQHGVTHAELGAYLLGLWGLPYPIVEAVAHHHAPQRVPHEDFGVLGAVYVANLLCHEADGAEPGTAEPVDEGYLDALKVRDMLPAWRARAMQTAAAGVS